MNDEEIHAGDDETAGSQSVELPRLSKSIVPPPDYTSRSIRWRLLMLVAMLGFVMVAMKEAGKPENWKWMGFEEPKVRLTIDPTLELDALDALPKEPPPTSIKRLPADPEIEQQHLEQAPENTSRSRIEAQLSQTDPRQSNRAYPAAALRFWKTAIRKMDSQQQQDLFRFLRILRTGEALDAVRHSNFEKLVTILRQQRKRFHRDLLDQLAVLSDGTEDKTQLANELYESEQIWDKKILPAFMAALQGEDFSVSQLRQLERLQLALDPMVYAQVQDHTAFGWEGDSPAWGRMWERILAGELHSPTTATHLQLTSQPDFYRGLPVVVSGWVLSARKELKENSELGIAHDYELIVQPLDSKISPYYIYALELPSDFPPVSEKFSNLNERIDATGLFFKLRTYVDTAQTVRESPVILASTVQRVVDQTALPNSASSFKMTIFRWLAVIAFMLVLATALAWWAFQTSQTRRFQPGKNRTEKIKRDLYGLAADPGVQTDAEKIRELYD